MSQKRHAFRPVQPPAHTAHHAPTAEVHSRNCPHCQGKGTVRAATVPRSPGAERYVVTQDCSVCQGQRRVVISAAEAQLRKDWARALHGER